MQFTCHRASPLLVGSSCSVENSSSAASARAFFLKVALHDFETSNSFFARRLKSAEPCFTKNFAYSSNRQIKQLTLVFLPYHTFSTNSLIMSPLRGRTKMPAFRRLTD